MPITMNRKAFEQLIEGDIEAMMEFKENFTRNGFNVEWNHIVVCLRNLPRRIYRHNREQPYDDWWGDGNPEMICEDAETESGSAGTFKCYD